MIARFPNFSSLNINHQKELMDITSKFEPYSDFNFTSLFSWNVDDSTQISILNDNLVICMPDYISGNVFYSILGNNKLDESLLELLKLTNSLHLVPEIVVENLSNKAKFIIKEDRDNHDYIVSGLDLAELQASKLPKKLSLVEKFISQYPYLKVCEIELTDKENKKMIIESFNNWGFINNKLNDEVEMENKAIRRLLNNSHHLTQIRAIGIYDNDELIAFNIFETSTHSHGVSSFQKADKSKEGIYAFLTHEMAKNLVSSGYEYINFEQDLGIEGLRNSKLSYHPVRFLKKYTVEKV